MEYPIYLLVKVETEFYDPHGSPDDGGTVKFVEKIESQEDWWYNDQHGNPYADGETYNDEGVLRDEDDTEYYGEDGYNCEVEWTSINYITEEQYNEYKEIIEKYDNL